MFSRFKGRNHLIALDISYPLIFTSLLFFIVAPTSDIEQILLRILMLSFLAHQSNFFFFFHRHEFHLFTLKNKKISHLGKWKCWKNPFFLLFTFDFGCKLCGLEKLLINVGKTTFLPPLQIDNFSFCFYVNWVKPPYTLKHTHTILPFCLFSRGSVRFFILETH